MSDDLVKRLQSGIATKAQIMGGFTFDIPATQTLLAEAAAEITRLRAQVARLRWAIDACAGVHHDCVAKMQIARAALTPKGDTP